MAMRMIRVKKLFEVHLRGFFVGDMFARRKCRHCKTGLMRRLISLLLGGWFLGHRGLVRLRDGCGRCS